MKHAASAILLILFSGLLTVSAQQQRPKGCISKTPYIGAIIVDADTGQTLFEDKADAPGYPASTLKLMSLLVIQEQLEAGKVNLNDTVKVSATASKTGGSQVYLDPRETFPLEELLYAMMIQSANDAAVALAEHVAGSKEAFVDRMNAQAQKIGMKDSRFASVHGLPPSAGQQNDVSTARDMAKLARELCRHPSIFAYTSASYRQLRAGTPKAFDMRTHNPFLKEGVAGCDGFKTGYTATAGWSIVVTAKRDGRRVIVVVLGSDDRKLRDAKARELLNQAFSLLPAGAPPPPSTAAVPPPPPPR
ncbi:MAG: D-alanyl-D-alanine carboxypeptidase [Verrucomicrobiota bacterium]|nr:D-alanyl-D-alanine carboxypeptidase [Verrucomicrobiota bacterium]